jgi:pimeloyl-ACP methyl ester carboxylesterase
MWSDAVEYLGDAAQRSVLFWDVLRQRGNQYQEHIAQTAPNVLSFDYELVMHGRQLPRPVNYGLVRIVPPDGVTVDPLKRPFVVVDPRAGHGPGIGGFKADSEIGAALQGGHPCYLIGFLPDPVPGQTIEDVAEAEAAFLEEVIALHPEADGKPAVIGNCQGGWAVMLVAAMRPELFGPIIIAGSPLSYWAGVHGANPMRYTGGLVGGSWMAAFASDLGNGIFDGASLVQNFENLNPANTLWTKQYNLYSKIDTEPPRYLEFEKYWGGHVLLTGEEIQFIVDKLFVGNKLSSAEIVTRNGARVDLRAIRSPILVFCSKGDNITPPQQALGWITDLYESVDDIRMHGQTIIYSVHASVGHLGIFVSGGVARKEHDEFAGNIDLIDVLPPGLYEVVLERKTPGDVTMTLASGDYVARFVPRTLDDIRALGGNDLEDERRFATVERISEINYGIYRNFIRSWVRAFGSDATAKMLQRLHPARLQYELLSDKNPLMRGLEGSAARVRDTRRPAAADNPFLQYQAQLSQQIVTALDAWRDARDAFYEQMFLGIYGSPVLQAAVGMRASDEPPRPRPSEGPDHRRFVLSRIEELRGAIEQGGLREAAVRAMLYVGLANGAVDERSFAVVQQIRAEQPERRPLAEFKQAVREQLFMLLIDEEHALAAIPGMLSEESERIPELIAALRRVMSAPGEPNSEQVRRLARVEALVLAASQPRRAGAAKATISAQPVPPSDADAAKRAKPSRERVQSDGS